jgi:peptidoglycan/LPS O-acetylase OafA/YrhL
MSHALPNYHIPGQFGVTVFFFLSGYLITTLLRIEIEDAGRADLRAFYIRRALRILPPFYAVLAIAIALGLVVPGAVILNRATLALALHYANYFVIHRSSWAGLPPGTNVYWSLAVEEHFYLGFPWLFLWLQRARTARRRAVCLWAACALVLAWRSWLVFVVHAPQTRTFIGTDTRIDSLLFGCALAVYGNPALDPLGPISEKSWKTRLFPVALGVLAACFALGDVIWFRETIRYTLQGLALVPVFVCAVRFPSWGALDWLSRPAVRLVGALSYSLYLVHDVLLSTFARAGLPTVPRALLGLAASLAVALLIRRFVERPAMRLRKQLLGQAVRSVPYEVATDRSASP